MNKHTPGPWRAEGSAADGNTLRVLAADSWICDMPTAYDDAPGSGDVVGIEADACLIAAAPELFAVALKCEECRDNGWEWGALIEELQELARSAIAKATGN